MPYGELIPGMAYLVRRLLENTSNDSFLRASFSEEIPPEILLMNPLEQHNDVAAGSKRDESPITVQIRRSRRTVPGVSQRAADRFCD